MYVLWMKGIIVYHCQTLNPNRINPIDLIEQSKEPPCADCKGLWLLKDSMSNTKVTKTQVLMWHHYLDYITHIMEFRECQGQYFSVKLAS